MICAFNRQASLSGLKMLQATGSLARSAHNSRDSRHLVPTRSASLHLLTDNNIVLTLHQKLECLYYPVVYRHYVKLRRYFSPANGDIKPDTPRVRELLHEGGWL